jgi:hypothetical protein
VALFASVKVRPSVTVYSPARPAEMLAVAAPEMFF